MRVRQVAAATAAALLLGGGGTAVAARCPAQVSGADLGGAQGLRALNAKEWSFGPRPTGSPGHAAMVDWLEGELRRVHGLRLSAKRFRMTRWTAGATALVVRSGDASLTVPVAAPVPYSRPTDAQGSSAPLVYVPADQAISAAAAAGRIVVREAPAGSVPPSVFTTALLGFGVYDPAHLIDPDAPFEGDFLNYNARVHDLRDAAAAGARGILFLKDLPDAQLAGHDEPYEGTEWGVPAVFLGADAAQRLRAVLGDDPGASATLTLRAQRKDVETRSLFATLPGGSRERLVVESHTDGTNAFEDNGPVAILAMARHLAGLPRACRPKTIQFALSTAHFFQHIASPKYRHGGAGWLARRLDAEYDRGTVAAVIVLEHLGARHYAAGSRSPAPGRILRRTATPALRQVLVTPSRALRSAVSAVVARYRLDPTVLLAGADLADAERAPQHCSFGGEGTPYNERLLPTVASISAPMNLYGTAFGLESIDFARMRDETQAYTELVLRMSHMSRAAIAGDVLAERTRRRAGAPGCPTDI